MWSSYFAQPALLSKGWVCSETSCQIHSVSFSNPHLIDETVVNGGQIFYKRQFGINGDDSRSTWLTGLLNSAPYLCSAVIGCWLTVPFNHVFGRRGTLFITCFFSAAACLWQGFVNSWWHMFIARFFLGFGIGPKSATCPIYAAETSPPQIRGALVMQFQMWTAFGIMLGFVADLVFFKVSDPPHILGLNWRLMMSSAMLPAVVVCCFVFTVPESPRWVRCCYARHLTFQNGKADQSIQYMSKNRHYKAYESMEKLRYKKVQAARDVFYMHTLLEAEEDLKANKKNIAWELITVPRNRRALIASEIVMFMQQVCSWRFFSPPLSCISISNLMLL